MCCECFFCDEGRFLVNKKIGLKGTNWIVYEDENVFITPDVSPILKGHFLIVSKEHINSFGNGNKKIFLSVQKAKKYLLEKIYCQKQVLFFEHGAVISHSAGGCIDHAHIHTVPLDERIDVDEYLSNNNLLNSCNSKMRVTYEILHNLAEEGKPYIAYGYEESGFWVRRVAILPTQFFRLMISSYYPREFNWKLACNSKLSKQLFKQTMDLAIPLE